MNLSKILKNVFLVIIFGLVVTACATKKTVKTTDTSSSSTTETTEKEEKAEKNWRKLSDWMIKPSFSSTSQFLISLVSSLFFLLRLPHDGVDIGLHCDLPTLLASDLC